MEPAHIIGYGARTAVGPDAPSTAAAVRAGVANIGAHPYMIDLAGEPMVVATVPGLEELVDPVDRFAALAVPAASEAMERISGPKEMKEVPLILSLPEPRPGIPKELGRQLGERLQAELTQNWPVSGVEIVSRGHAAGISIFGRAMRRMARDDIDVALVGGVDSYIFADTLEWLDARDELHSERTTWGFSPGEAAAFCVLCRRSFLQNAQVRPVVAVISEGSATEPNRNHTDTVCIGDGMTEAWRAALQQPGFADAYIDHTICDLNGDPYRGNEFGFAMLRTGAHFTDEADFATPADCWGDVGAASGPLFAILTAMAETKGYGHGPHTFAFAGSDGGDRAAMVLAAAGAEG